MPFPRFTLLILLFPLLAMLSHPVSAFEEINKSYFGDLALGGHDAASYFTTSKATRGNKAHALEWKGATQLFSSDANPEAFAPQYGGYCSNQMSLGNMSDIDTGVWRIIDNKLYLFGHYSGRVRWASETEQRISDIDRHWRSYLE